jgi:hypothetical protein
MEHILQITPLHMQVAAPELEPVVGRVRRAKEGQALHMIHVRVSQEDVRNATATILGHLIPEQAQPGSGIKHETMIAAAHFNAGCVPAIF